MTIFRFKDKTQFNIRLTHFLYNGISILGAKLGMNQSEIARLAIYEFVKGHFTKQEMDVLANQDDVVEEWIADLKRKSGTVLFGYDKDDDFVKQKLKEGEIEEIGDEEENKVFDENERIFKPIREKYAFIRARDFMEKTMMTPEQAAEYFKNYSHKNVMEDVKKYLDECKKYREKKYPKEVKEFESKLEKLKGEKRKSAKKK